MMDYDENTSEKTTFAGESIVAFNTEMTSALFVFPSKMPFVVFSSKITRLIVNIFLAIFFKEILWFYLNK